MTVTASSSSSSYLLRSDHKGH